MRKKTGVRCSRKVGGRTVVVDTISGQTIESRFLKVIGDCLDVLFAAEGHAQKGY